MTTTSEPTSSDLSTGAPVNAGTTAGVKCGARRDGECGTPGPFMAHCTESSEHLWNCYHSETGLSWNDAQWAQYVLGVHDCGDDGCPARGQQGPWR